MYFIKKWTVVFLFSAIISLIVSEINPKKSKIFAQNRQPIDAPIQICVSSAHSKDVRSVTISPDGKTFVTGSYDRTIKFWNRTTGKEIRTLRGHTSGVRIVAISPDSKTLISGDETGVIKVWELSTGLEKYALREHFRETVNPNARTAQESLRREPVGISTLTIRRDGETFASGDLDGHIKIWDLKTGKLLRTLSTFREVGEGTAKSFTYSSVESIIFSSDGRTLSSGGSNNSVPTFMVWNLSTGEVIRTLLLPDQPSTIGSVALSLDGNTLVSGDIGNVTKIWDLTTEKEVRILSGGSGQVSFSPDGKALLVVSIHDTITLWNLASGQIIHQIKPATNSLFGFVSAAVSHDSTIIIGGDSNGTVKIWNLTNTEESRELCTKSKNNLSRSIDTKSSEV
jgi:WD40 repeat protein